jgi:hypothetical protein
MTMAEEVEKLILEKTGTTINIAANHIKCFCHKLALIFNAGLAALSISEKRLVPSKDSTLGFVPGLEDIEEESKEVEAANSFEPEEPSQEELDTEEINESNSDKESEEGGIESEQSQSKGSNGISLTLKKVYILIIPILLFVLFVIAELFFNPG